MLKKVEKFRVGIFLNNFFQKKLFKKILTVFLSLIFISLLFSRFLFLDFGLPHVYQADEPELVEYSLKYAVNMEKLRNGDFNFFKPFSFVYGTLPTYTNTLLLFPFLKITNFFDLSQGRYEIYLYLRIIYALFGVLACVGVYYLAKEILENVNLALVSSILFSLVYSFVWLTKYVNNDTLIVLVSVWMLYYFLKYERRGEKKNLYLAIFFLATGISIKITFALALFYPLIKLALNKKYVELANSFLILFVTYFLTNPFTFFYFQEFLNRILEMRTKENGIVIDSYNTNPFKYFFSITDQTSIFVLIFSTLAIFEFSKKKTMNFAIYFILINLLFFSLSSRLVERWIIPILPILIIYSIQQILKIKNKLLGYFFLSLIFFEITIRFIAINTELNEGSSIVRAYLYIKENYQTEPASFLVVSERGLHPIKGGNFRGSPVIVQDFQFNPYESEGAFQSFPEGFENFENIVFSTRVKDYYSNPYIQRVKPEYFQKWNSFYKLLNNSDIYFKKSFGSDSRKFSKQESIEIYTKK